MEREATRRVDRRGFLRLAGASVIALSAGAMLSGGDAPDTPERVASPRRSPIAGLTPGARVVYSTHTTFATQAVLRRYLQAYPEERIDIVELGSADAVQRVTEERDDPVADVWIHSHATDLIVMANLGLLKDFPSLHGEEIDERYRDERGRWFGIGLRPQVIAFNRAILADADEAPPTSVLGLAERTWFSNELGGWEGTAVVGLPDLTTPSTLAWLASIYGEAGVEAGRDFMSTLRQSGAGIPGADATLLEAISQRSYAIGAAEAPVALARIALGDDELSFVYPEQADDGPLAGTWLSPTCVSLLRDSDEASQLMNFLLSAEAARIMVTEGFELPTRPGIEVPDAFEVPESFRESELSLSTALLASETAREDVRSIWGI